MIDNVKCYLEVIKNEYWGQIIDLGNQKIIGDF